MSITAIERIKNTFGLNKPEGASKRDKQKLAEREAEQPDRINVAKDVLVGKVGAGVFERGVRGDIVRAEVVEGPGEVFNGRGIRDEAHIISERNYSPTQRQEEMEWNLAASFLSIAETAQTKEGYLAILSRANLAAEERLATIELVRNLQEKKQKGRREVQNLKDNPLAVKTGLIGSLLGSVFHTEIEINGKEVDIFNPLAQRREPSHYRIKPEDMYENYRLDIDPPRWVELIDLIRKTLGAKKAQPIIGRLVVEQKESGEQIVVLGVWLPKNKRDELANAIELAAAAANTSSEKPPVAIDPYSVVKKAIQLEMERKSESN